MRFALLLFALSLLHPLSARADFGLHAGAQFEFGAMGDSTEATAYESRSIGAFGLQLMPGYRLFGKSLMAGLVIHARFLSQLSGPNTVDYGGRSLLVGPAVSYELALLKFLLGWDIRARHAAKPDTTFSGSGLRFLLGYRIVGNTWADLQILSTSYKDRQTGDERTEITSDPVKSTTVGFGLSLSF
jgi:hypothetical protein